MADELGDKIEVKTLKNTDLKPEDISKAIDASTKALSGKTKSESAKTAAKPAKSSASKPKTAAKPAETKDSGGSQVIVKKHSSYVGPAAAPAQAPAVEAIARENKVELKPPSELGKPVVTPQAKANPASPQPTVEPAVSSSPPTVQSKVETPKPEPARPPSVATPTPAKETPAEAQQALKTFDTNEYHLPIKPTAGNHYLNRFVSWSILILVFVLVGGYVLIQLEVIDPSEYGF